MRAPVQNEIVPLLGKPKAREYECEIPRAWSALRRLLLLAAAAAAVLILIHSGPLQSATERLLEVRVLGQTSASVARPLYVLCVAGLVATGTPRLLLYALGGLAFGFWQGLLLAQLGTLCGSYITFRTARWGGREWVVRRCARFRGVQPILLTPASIMAVALIRQLPLSSTIISLGLALTSVNGRTFLIGSFLGFLPQGIVATLLGSGLVNEALTDALAGFSVAALALLLGAVVLWRRRKISAGLRKRLTRAQNVL